MRRNHIRIFISIFFTVCVFTLAATSLSAQEPAGATGDPQGSPRDLGLTDDQKAQLKAIKQNAKEQLQALKNDESLSPEDRRARAQEIRRNTREQIASILTTEQRQILQDRREQRRERGFGRGPGKHGNRSGRKLEPNP